MPQIAPRPITAGTPTSQDQQRRPGYDSWAAAARLPARPKRERQPKPDAPPTAPAPDAAGTLFATALLAGAMFEPASGERSAPLQPTGWSAPESGLRLRDRKI